MTRNPTSAPDARQARAALDAVSHGIDAGLERGLYPRSFAAISAAWTGVTTALFGLEHPLWILLAAVGVFAYAYYRHRRGAWVQEVGTRGQLWLVLHGALLLCGLVLGGMVARERLGLEWAPVAAGAVIGLGLFAWMELAHRRTRARIANGNRG